MNFPNKITFLSSDTEVELQGIAKVDKNNKVATGNYKFTKAKENLGKSFPMPISQIESLLISKLITIE